MIAKNYIRYPEALRFQVEMFHRSYKNSPRIMRLMECIFSFSASVPSWVREAKLRASALVKKWKAAQVDFDFRAVVKRITPMINGFFYGPKGEAWSGRGLVPMWLRSLVKEGHSKEDFKFTS